MNNFTCVIVEDLQIAANYLKNCCVKSGIIDVRGVFPDATSALDFLNSESVDIIFLDVEMPGATGFELMDNLAYSPQIILTTSKTEYAYDAFQYNVTDYLKKPFTYQRFLDALQKLKRDNAQETDEQADHIFIKANGKLVRLNNDEILYIESMGDYVRFVTPAHKYVTHSTIKAMGEKVSKNQFMKIHRSYIVNLTKIDDLRDNMLFIKGIELPISKAHKADVRKRLNIV